MLYKILYLNFDKTIISAKPGDFSEKLKTLTSSNYHKVFFSLKFYTSFLLSNAYKRVLEIF